MPIHLNDSQVEKYAELVHKSIEDDQPNKIIATLCMLSKEERKVIVTYKVDGNPALCFACLQNKPDCVKYLLEECNADIEQRGLFIEPDKKWRIEAPPLWCSTVPDDGFEIVRILLEHGADVNGHSHTLSTPVRSACYSKKILIVKYLVDHGADILKPNMYGGTCLMNAVESKELCEFLISKGANVNFVDVSGNTALHFAVQENSIESVKVLLQNGANINAKNRSHKTALNIAAYKGCVVIIEYLLSTKLYPVEDEIEALDLLGCILVDDDVTNCLKMWQKALILRTEHLGYNLFNDIHEIRPNTALQNAVEIFSVEDLNLLTNPTDLYTQALLKYIRIYGEEHEDTTFKIVYRGAFYADNGCYQLCIDLWIYAYSLRLKGDDPLNRDSISSAKSIIAVFCEMERKWEADKSRERMQMKDILRVFQMLVQQIEFGKSALNVRPFDIRDLEEYQYLMALSLHTIRLFQCLNVHGAKQDEFFEHVNYLIKIDPRGMLNQTLLHVCVNPSLSSIGRDHLTGFPSLYVLRVLLLGGANYRVRDDNGLTPLDYSFIYSYPSEEQTDS